MPGRASAHRNIQLKGVSMRSLCLIPALAVTAATAGTVQLTSFTNNSGNAQNISTQAVLSSDLTTFTIALSNLSSGTITSFYIESGSALFGSTGLAFQSFTYSHAGMAYSNTGGVGPNEAEGSLGWNGNFFRARPLPPPTHNGVNMGETLTMNFTHNGSFSLAAFQAALDSGDIRFALHYQSWTGANGGDFSEWLVTPAIVPLPPAVWAGLGTLGLALGIRKFRRR